MTLAARCRATTGGGRVRESADKAMSTIATAGGRSYRARTLRFPAATVPPGRHESERTCLRQCATAATVEALGYGQARACAGGAAGRSRGPCANLLLGAPLRGRELGGRACAGDAAPIAPLRLGFSEAAVAGAGIRRDVGADLHTLTRRAPEVHDHSRAGGRARGTGTPAAGRSDCWCTGEQLQALRTIRAAAGPSVLIIWTVFSPLMIARYLLPVDAAQLLEIARTEPDALTVALEAIAETLVGYVRVSGERRRRCLL